MAGLHKTLVSVRTSECYSESPFWKKSGRTIHTSKIETPHWSTRLHPDRKQTVMNEDVA